MHVLVVHKKQQWGKETNKCRSEWLYCTPKTNILLEFNYTSIKKKKKNYLSKHAYAHKHF